jgi:hypothetical protein
MICVACALPPYRSSAELSAGRLGRAPVLKKREADLALSVLRAPESRLEASTNKRLFGYDSYQS